ncbi:mitochondrial calcium uniporter regulator 1 [Hypomesus transpacificus]|uniref:mitochondrial calcium uniporter regulator 1 n=1 Tax=Hypomesus transpacificus TaxID=137520 RepID=UPI001F076753|nr:mitochondrial calcium uniporter regulator 1 [Hypomesus transpacificus]
MSLKHRFGLNSRIYTKYALYSEHQRICRKNITSPALPSKTFRTAPEVVASLRHDPAFIAFKQHWKLKVITRLTANKCFPKIPFSRGMTTSINTLQYDLKTDMTKSGSRKLFFDTHAVVRLLEDNGFSPQQAEVIMKVLVRTTNSNMDTIYNDIVTKVQQEILLQRVMSQIASVKKDMIILEKSEFSTLLAENEKVKTELLHLKVQLSDMMNKVRLDNILNMHLEKSRIKEMKAEHDKRLLETQTNIMEMNAEQDRHLTQSNMKIDTEVAGLKTMLVSHKLDTIKYLAGSVFTCLTVVLGFYRLWM